MKPIARLYDRDGNSFSLLIDEDMHGAIHRHTTDGSKIEVSGSQDDMIEYFIDMLREKRISPFSPEVAPPCGCENCLFGLDDEDADDADDAPYFSLDD